MNFNKYSKIKKKYDVLTINNENTNLLHKLLFKKNKSLGKSYGKIVSRHRGGGVKRKYRLINNYIYNSKQKFGILRSIEYDPNRSSFIGLIQLNDNSFCYKIVSSKSEINDVFSLNTNNEMIKDGDILKLRNIPLGLIIHNIESKPGKGPVYSKSGGSGSILLSKDSKYARVSLPSKKERLFDLDCYATLGVPSNIYNNLNKKYKAGTNRLLNKRPTVRGVAMNPVDHPHGGGEGKKSGKRLAMSP